MKPKNENEINIFLKERSTLIEIKKQKFNEMEN